MKYLITGAGGMLGQDLQAALKGQDVAALSRAELDVADLEAVRTAAKGRDVIINTAAFTNVDEAESHEEEARAVNATGARNLAIAASENSARLVQVSTDYVFDGRASEPYAENTELNPISAYGRSKAEGERLAVAAHPRGTFIVRTAWLYGQHGPNFAKTMLKLAASRDTVTVVDDQFGQPTWTADLAAQIVRLSRSDAPAGVYHGTNSGTASWYEFAHEVFRLTGLDADRVTRTDSSQFLRPAPRPAFSVLGHDAWRAAGLDPMRDWEEALADAAGQGVLSVS